MNEVTELKSLLEKVKAIDIKYADVVKKEQYDFNVFSIIRKKHEEVGLHSAFLRALFDPKGGHGQGIWMLNRFLKKVGVSSVEGETDVQVFSEYTRLRRLSESEGIKRDSIDIYIREGARAIVIENKIYAADQPKQIERYVEFAKDGGVDNVSVIYLTLDGHAPSEQSLGKIEKDLVITASYREHVDGWLTECIEHMDKYPTTRESLVLYQRVVRTLTGVALNEEVTMEIAKHLIKSPDVFRLGMKITEGMDTAKVITEFKFWRELKNALSVTGIILADDGIVALDLGQKDEKGMFESFNNRKKPWYGIKVFLGNLKQHPSTQIYFYVAVEWNVYYGFGLCDQSGKHIEPNEENYKYIQEAFKDKCYEEPAWMYPQSQGLRIDFKHFNGDAIGLIDEDKQKTYLDKLAGEIKEAIEEGVTILNNNGLLVNEKPIFL